MRAIAYLSGLVAVASYAFLLWTLWTGLLPAAGGLMPFDLRATGYTPAEAGAYLAALTDEGRALMRGPVAVADTIFPVALALWIAALAVRPRSGRMAWVAVLLALAYLGADLAENAAVRRLIEGPVVPDPLTVSGASVLTISKFVTLAGAVLAMMLSRLSSRR